MRRWTTLLCCVAMTGCSPASSSDRCQDILDRLVECGASVPAEAICSEEMLAAHDHAMSASCEDLAAGLGAADGWGDVFGTFFRNWDAWFDSDPGADEDDDVLCGGALCEGREPIEIVGDEALADRGRSGVVGGSGTAEDPYVISGWRLGAGNGAHDGLQVALRIAGTTAHVVVEHNDLRAGDVGIQIEDALNVVVRGNTVRWMIGDIALSVEGEIAEDGERGVGVAVLRSASVTIESNEIRDVVGGHGSASMLGGDPGRGGAGIGLLVERSVDVTVSDNDVLRISGNWGGGVGPSGNPLVPGGLGAPGGDAVGVLLRGSSSVLLDGNRVSEIDGRAGGPGGTTVFGVAGDGGHGGAATGILAEGCAGLAIDGNLVSDVDGGLGAAGGGTLTFGGNGGYGGDAVGVHLRCDADRSCSPASISGNAISDIDGWTGGGGFVGTVPGIGGKGGAAFGILVEGDVEVALEDNDIRDVDSGSGGPGFTWLFHWGESGVEAEVCFGERVEPETWGARQWVCSAE